ncbi:MAG: hypothetical protein O3C45_10165 [Bacteroidetes bacterium]|nr:hypothetical protein [Bacteroidota bacterium]MDA0875407.1 hypothetical protein [Bacteroidota bacterium]
MSRFAPIIALLLLCPPAFGQRAETLLSADSVTVGDRFELTVLVGHDGTREIVFPHQFLPDSLQTSTVFTLGDFEILGVSRMGQRSYNGSGRIDSVVYEATTFALDTARVAGVPVGLVNGPDTLTALTPPAFLRIGSLVPEDATELKDLAPLAEFERAWWPWIVGFLALAAVLYGLWRWRRRGQDEEEATVEPATPAIPPFEEAVRRLASLQQADLSDPAVIKPFYVELTDILRTYVGKRTHVPALESTTRELLSRLKGSRSGKVLPEDVIREIDQILTHSDLVKFADLRPILEQTRSMVDGTRAVIEQTETVYRDEERRREAARLQAEEAARYAPPAATEEV